MSKPYIETSEEVLRLTHIRTDRAALSMIRDALFELAIGTDGLDEEIEGVENRARQAEELLVLLPGTGSSGRRSPEQRLRDVIDRGRRERKERDEEQLKVYEILAIVEKELPDVVAAARERVNSEHEHPVGDTIETPSDEPDQELKEVDLSSRADQVAESVDETVDETAHTTPVASQPQAVGQP